MSAGEPLRLRGRACAVTGAGAGIGRACALRVAAEGGRVLVTDLRPEAAERVAGEIRGAGGEALALGCDVTRSAEVDAAAARCAAHFGALDAWINNAANPAGGAIDRLADADWRAVQAGTLDGTFFGLRAALRLMLPRGRGAIVNISSGAGIGAELGLAAYGAAKAGVQSLTRNAALEYAGAGIRVNCIAPGPIDTQALGGWLASFPGGRAGFEAQLPQRRLGRPDEIAAMAAFLLSDDASYVNGAVIAVDGAVSARLASPRADVAR